MNDLHWVIDTSGLDEQALESCGLVDREGWYHFEITRAEKKLEGVKRDGTKAAIHILYTLIVLHDVDGQSPVGSRLFHRLYVGGTNGGKLSDGLKKNLIRWGIATGVLEWKEVNGKKIAVDRVTKTPQMSLDRLCDVVGRQIIAQVSKESSKQYGDQFKIPFGTFYRPDDPEVAHVPKNEAAIAAIESSGNDDDF